LNPNKDGDTQDDIRLRYFSWEYWGTQLAPIKPPPKTRGLKIALTVLLLLQMFSTTMIFATPLTPQYHEPVSITLIVVSENGTALHGVSVVLDSGQRAITDQNGTCTIKNVEPGEHTLYMKYHNLFAKKKIYVNNYAETTYYVTLSETNKNDATESIPEMELFNIDSEEKLLGLIFGYGLVAAIGALLTGFSIPKLKKQPSLSTGSGMLGIVTGAIMLGFDTPSMLVGILTMAAAILTIAFSAPVVLYIHRHKITGEKR